MPEERVTFPSTDATIEGRVSTLVDPEHCVVMAHPHPQMGGDMDNNVVRLVSHWLNRHNIATLRFNFRGMGASTGSYSDGKLEPHDLLAAMAEARRCFPNAMQSICGYSFGAWICWKLAATGELQCPVTLISPAPNLMPFDESPTLLPVHVFMGGADTLIPLARVQSFAKRLGSNARLTIHQQADHFWINREAWLAERIAPFVTGA